MKEGFRQCMAWLHTWTGLMVGWVLLFVFVTGTAGYFVYEIDRWMRPELPLAAPADMAVETSVALAERYLERNAVGADSWSVTLPGDRGQSNLSVNWRMPPDPANPNARSRFKRAVLDPVGGAEIKNLPVRATGGGHLLYRMHYQLHYINYEVAFRLIGVCTMSMLMAIVTGVITHKKIFTDFFTFRPGKGQRSWLDAHNLISVTALPFFLMITYSGLVFFAYQYMPAGLQAAYGATEKDRQQFFEELPGRGDRGPATGVRAERASLVEAVRQAEAHWGPNRVASVSVRHPGDAASVISVRPREAGGRELLLTSLRYSGVTGAPLGSDDDSKSANSVFNDGMLQLHEGRFSGPFVRWLYFLSGLLGCAMISTGLVLWTVKRKGKQDKLAKAGQRGEFGFRLVECLNIGTVAGLPVAVAAYFWANRLIPADFTGRRDWEVHVMYIAWGALIVYPAFRNSLRAWVDELWLASAAFGLLPIINWLTTDRHLGVTLPAGDWELAGFDLVMLGLAAFFAVAAQKVRRRIAVTANAASDKARLALKSSGAVAQEVSPLDLRPPSDPAATPRWPRVSDSLFPPIRN